jgi:dUTP pyrophosphatase
MAAFKCVKLRDDAQIPRRRSEGAAGFDLVACEDVLVNKGEIKRINTGIAIEIPHGYYGRIVGRSSGNIVKHFVIEGVIDSDYRGELTILFYNCDDYIAIVNKNARIAQLIIERCEIGEAVEVSELSSTERGCGCFGSTGSA